MKNTVSKPRAHDIFTITLTGGFTAPVKVHLNVGGGVTIPHYPEGWVVDPPELGVVTDGVFIAQGAGSGQV